MGDPVNVPLILGVPELLAVTDEVLEPVAVSEDVGVPLNVPLREGVPDPDTVTEEVPEPVAV